jgi:hypothetical protein
MDATDVLDRAAELRARGLAWEAAADQIEIDAGDLRRLARDAGADFRRRLAAARREVIAEGFAEAVLVLRKLVRSEVAGVSGKAADCLAKIWMTTRRHRRGAAKPAAVAAAPAITDERRKEAEELVNFLASKSDEEIAHLARLTGTRDDFIRRFGFDPDDPPDALKPYAKQWNPDPPGRGGRGDGGAAVGRPVAGAGHPGGDGAEPPGERGASGPRVRPESTRWGNDTGG